MTTTDATIAKFCEELGIAAVLMEVVMGNVPKLRFREFSESWSKYTLRELTSYVDYRGKTPPKSDSGVFSNS